MNATIWHNPACGTSRKTLAILEDSGANVTVIEYLKTPYERAKLEQLLRDTGMTPKDALRTRGTDAEERGLHEDGPQGIPEIVCDDREHALSDLDGAPRRVVEPCVVDRIGRSLGDQLGEADVGR